MLYGFHCSQSLWPLFALMWHDWLSTTSVTTLQSMAGAQEQSITKLGTNNVMWPNLVGKRHKEGLQNWVMMFCAVHHLTIANIEWYCFIVQWCYLIWSNGVFIRFSTGRKQTYSILYTSCPWILNLDVLSSLLILNVYYTRGFLLFFLTQ